MGVSTDAYLFWGLCADDEVHWANIGREHDDPDYVEDEDGDWEEAYAKRMGLNPPLEPYEEYKDKYPPFWEAVRKLVKKSGCRIDWHCADEFAMPLVAVDESFVRVSRGCPAEIKEGALGVKPEWEPRLRRFCGTMGIKWSEPKWWLVSWRG